MTQRCCFGEPCDRDRVHVPFNQLHTLHARGLELADPRGDYLLRYLAQGDHPLTFCPRHRAYALDEASPPPAVTPRNLYPLHVRCGGALIPRRKRTAADALPHAAHDPILDCTKCGGTASETFVAASETT